MVALPRSFSAPPVGTEKLMQNRYVFKALIINDYLGIEKLFL